jgi:hypothetical protein
MLYCISANYTPKAMQAMAKNPNTNRRDAVEKLVTAAGGKLVAMYGTMVDGPGAMVIVDVDPRCRSSNSGRRGVIRRRSKREVATSVHNGRSNRHPQKANTASGFLQSARCVGHKEDLGHNIGSNRTTAEWHACCFGFGWLLAWLRCGAWYKWGALRMGAPI